MIITYVILIFINAFFIINTVWISLKMINKQQETRFLIQFIINLITEFFVKEVAIIFLKTSVFYSIVKDSKIDNCKRTLIAILALLS